MLPSTTLRQTCFPFNYIKYILHWLKQCFYIHTFICIKNYCFQLLNTKRELQRCLEISKPNKLQLLQCFTNIYIHIYIHQKYIRTLANSHQRNLDHNHDCSCRCVQSMPRFILLQGEGRHRSRDHACIQEHGLFLFKSTPAIQKNSSDVCWRCHHHSCIAVSTALPIDAAHTAP